MKLFVLLLIVFSLSLACFGQLSETERKWNEPVEPFRIIGNVYYVGASDITSFLITTPKGHFLLDAGFAETVPQIKENIKRLGFKLEDVKFLLNSQSHSDHSAGFAELKNLTKATMVASEGDKSGLERGGRNDPHWGDDASYTPVKVDRVVRDGEELSLGGSRMKAVLTPGHTPGCTTWTINVKDKDKGKNYDVVFVCSASVPSGYKLVGNEKYPNIVSDYEMTFRVLKTLQPDVFLGAHGVFFDLLGKAEKLRSGKEANPFIDPQGYKAYLARAEQSFRESLAKQNRP